MCGHGYQWPEEPMPQKDEVERIAAAEDPLDYWCQACRETGALHCIATGDMAQLPYSERAARYAALRPSTGADPMTQTQDAFCNKCGYVGPTKPDGLHNRPKDGQPCHYMACATPEAHLRSTSPAGEVGEMIERLNAKTYESDGPHGIFEVLRNPDGPAAAAMLERLAASEKPPQSGDSAEAMRLLRELRGQVLQARDGFGIWPYEGSSSMKDCLARIEAALAKGGAA